MRDYYLFLVNDKKYSEHNARHAVARRIAVLALGILKSGEKYNPKKGDRDYELEEKQTYKITIEKLKNYIFEDRGLVREQRGLNKVESTA